MPPRGVAIVVPTLGSIDVQVESRIDAILKPLNTIPHRCWPVGMDTATARTEAVKAVREAGCEHIFFIDHDVIVPPNALTMLYSRELPVVCGLYYLKTKPPEPLTVIDRRPYTDWTHGDLVTVDCTGLGCALIDLSVFDEIDEPWFQSGPKYTEDAYFYDKLAKATGIRPVVDTGVCCAHKNLETGELFFFDVGSGKPTWMGLDGVKHTAGPVEPKESEKE